MTPHFQIPLDLPHAATVASRIDYLLQKCLPLLKTNDPHTQKLMAINGELLAILMPYQGEEDNPAEEEAQQVKEKAASLGRLLVDELEALHIKVDRLGQCVRNLFECLSLGEEGAVISLRAGENPNSALRPI